ncbi:hypothetical protein OUZ56_016211 [Daphnia magna]|uniref:Uncharacterized protein n=1 Tax=Daphnia magna TaxID=35525 RepID=A0ABR0AQ34_9CRUS|nr:hypothetical protein OUZ56_016211 [Daphnia magna]
MSTEPRTVKTRAAVAAEEVALDEARNDIAGLNGWLERVEARVTKEYQRLEQEFRETAERQDTAIAALDGKTRTLEAEVRRFNGPLPQLEAQMQQRQSALVESELKRIRKETDARDTSLIGTLRQDDSLTKRVMLESAKAMKKSRKFSLLS